MNPSTTFIDTHINVEFPDQRLSFPDQTDEPNDTNVPFLLQTSHAKSKSSIFNELLNFATGLKWSGLDHSSCIGKLISYLTFITFTITVPIIASLAIQVPPTASEEDPISFNKLVQLPESALAAIAFFTLTRFFHNGYRQQLDKGFRYLASILLPSFFLELAHKIVFFSTVTISIPYVSPGVPLNSIVFVSVLASWVYRTGVFLLVCVLFRLTCELQILRLEGFHKLLEECGSETGAIFEEHLRIRKQLSITSHRYRFFIISCLFTITVSQFGAMFLVLASKSQKSFFNSGDLVVCSAVQLSGCCLCLMGATRITHRAQGIVSVATRWHMLVTSASNCRSDQQKKDVTTLLDHGSLVSGCRDTDLGSSPTFITISSQDSSSFHTRQALVAYLEHNNKGITLFGYALDRGLLHTLFAFEFSLVLWILRSSETTVTASNPFDHALN
ncbi:hypothetical protein F0562_011665 [Nyssa sinensis]|uniref:Uncharacterized protein n=1 Tax=Nyssa sinensis TaxID=561372 RepID=A0A5J4ZUC0_9ASTE|nr:hypothetical protein F0562_011665 [Nyssa sinensis]